ncbi:TPA: DNA (cytosine-5-)-methyltransferase [Listeria monocytogenes]|nr:DNA (cytosine-5-)-methyltransferase [Listeria monocytogenes]EDG2730827.1 DNA (cytosine-5-)-methyltransferase [Listeria monocytogenes]EDH3848502.1 DNA (cytosine-5-)-methyltransferase [Listeria monocytogenes]EDO0402145.1 DNA (cytosine-5-)-methyltransferase [Listeria monocytogenes]HDI4719832.1 DNA (cytosine-5-)-methyltransferase [Listeria monocytogenes]
MNFLDLFAGIGGFRLGMERAGHTCVGYVEIDKYARKSYQAIHDTEGEWTAHDITKVTDDEWRELRGTVDVICGGFPCQSFSIAGKRRGFEDIRGTLFFDIARAAKQIKPRILFLENVKGLLSHNKGQTFATILRALHELGYDAEWQVCNSKNFGVPQNRERVFIVGHLRGTCGRKIFPFGGNDTAVNSKQPGQIIIGTTKNADAKGSNYRHDTFSSDGIIGCLTATDYKQPKQIVVLAGKLPGPHEQNSRVYDTEGVSPTLTTMQGGGQEPKIKVKEATKKGFADAFPGDSINISHPDSETRRGRVGKQLANTLLTGEEQAVVENDFRIRKLTSRECWRLQGFPDWAFDRAAEVNSNSQLYKQAGNSVTVNVIEAIAKKLD